MAVFELFSRPDSLRALFHLHRELRVVVDGALEGILGRIFVDDPEAPRAARMRVGVYEVFGGDAQAGSALLRSISRPCELVFPDDDGRWLARARRELGDAPSARDMQTFLPSTLSATRLLALEDAVDPAYRIVPVTADLAARVGPGLAPNRPSNFGSSDAFARAGFGCCALAGDELACAATTYALSSFAAEIAIATAESHRRRGLAVAVGAAMVRMCRERELAPVWTAANDASTRVARTLGFEPLGTCRIYDVAGSRRVERGWRPVLG